MKTGFVSIIGRANVGKSTLMNALVGEKIAIVSDKPQTTRTRVRGIYNDDNVQLVFIDTPGIHVPQNKLGEYMNKAATGTIGDADIIILVAECRPAGKTEKNLITRLRGAGVPVLLVLNKVDAVPKADVAAAIADYAGLYDFDEIIPISALKGDGVSIVMDEILKRTDEGVPMFDTDIATDMPMRELVQEIIREKFLNALHDEVPHGIAVETVTFKDGETGSGEAISRIAVNIICEKEQHKGIIIGKSGQMLKRAASESRKDLEDMFGTKVYLECFVKVRENWRDNDGFIKSYGLSGESDS